MLEIMRAEGPRHWCVEMTQAFSPHDFIITVPQPVGLGYYETGPLALT